MIVAGVDDAGRGSMLGPLVIAGASFEISRLERLSDIGVKDSKRLTPKKREELYPKIIEMADDYCIVRVRPSTIDKSVRKHELNRLEAKYMAKVVARLGSNPTYVDSCDVNTKRFGDEISRLSRNDTIYSHHRADSRFVVVSAASILAKVARDRSIARLQRVHDLGSGYPADSKTVRFVSRYISENDGIPQFARASWKPIRRLVDESRQRDLSGFMPR